MRRITSTFLNQMEITIVIQNEKLTSPGARGTGFFCGRFFSLRIFILTFSDLAHIMLISMLLDVRCWYGLLSGEHKGV